MSLLDKFRAKTVDAVAKAIVKSGEAATAATAAVNKVGHSIGAIAEEARKKAEELRKK